MDRHIDIELSFSQVLNNRTANNTVLSAYICMWYRPNYSGNWQTVSNGYRSTYLSAALTGY